MAKNRFSSVRAEMEETLSSRASKETQSTSTVKKSNSDSMEEYMNRRIQSFSERREQGPSGGRYSVVNDNYVSAFARDANKYLNDAINRYNGMTYAQAKSREWDDYRVATWNDLHNRAGLIREYLQTQKGSIGEGSYDDLMKFVDRFTEDSRKLNEQYQDLYRFYDQFSGEEEYNLWNRYQGKSYDDLVKIYDGLEDGADKKWLDDYMPAVLSRELPNMDIDASRKKVSNMKNALDVLRKNTRFVTDERGQRMVDNILAQYGDEDAIKLAISRENQKIQLAERAQEKMRQKGKFGSVTQAADFAEKSRFDPTNTDIGYRYVNGSENDRFDLEQKHGQYVKEFGYSAFDSLTDDQKAIYNYYANKGDRKSAADYLRYLKEDLSDQKAKRYFSGLQGKHAAELLVGIDSGLDQFHSSMTSMGAMLRGDDSYSGPSYKQLLSSYILDDMEDYGRKLPELLGGGSVGQMAYDAITTSANMAPSILASAVFSLINPALGQAVGTGLIGASAAGSGYQEMINSGYSVEQARIYGAAVGTAEAAMKHLLGSIGGIASKSGLGKSLARWAGNVDNALLSTILRITGSGFSEGLEESIQEAVDAWIKSEVTGERFELKASDVLYSGLLGAITGVAFDLPGSIIDVHNTKTQGKTVKAAKGLDKLKSLAEGSGNPDIWKRAQKINEDTGSYTIGRILNDVSAEITQENIDFLENSMVEKGLPRDIARKNAEIIGYVAEGGDVAQLVAVALDANPIVSLSVLEMLQEDSKLMQLLEATGKLKREKTGNTEGQEAVPTPGSVGKLNYEELFDNNTDGRTIANLPNGDSIVTEVEGISSNDGGKLMLKVQGVDTPVEASRISFPSSSEAAIFFAVGNMDIPTEAANKMVTLLRSFNDPTGQVAIDTLKMYTLGAEGIPLNKAMSGTTAVRLNKELADIGYTLGTEARKVAEDAFRIGREVYDADVNLAEKEKATLTASQKSMETLSGTKVNGVIYDGLDVKRGADGRAEIAGVTLNEQQRTGIDACELLGSIGYNIHIFRSAVDADGKPIGDNGSYRSADGSIHIDLNAGANGEGIMAYTIAHELTHHMKEHSPQKFRAFCDTLLGTLPGDVETEIDQKARILVNKHPKEYGSLSKTELNRVAMEEVVAECCETMLTDTDAAKRISRLLYEKDQSLGNRVKEFFTDLIRRLKNAYRGYDPDSYIAREAKKTIQKMDGLVELWAEMVVDGAENYRIAEAGEKMDGEGDVDAKYQARQSSKYKNVLDPKTVTMEDVKKMLEDIKAGKIKSGTYIPVRTTTPGIVQERLFADNLPIVMPVSKIYQAFAKDNGPIKGKNVRGHQFSVNDIMTIIDRMDSPDYIFSQENGRGVEVIKLENVSDNSVVIVEFDNHLNPAYMNGYEGGMYNVSVTMFNVDGGDVGLFMYSQKNGWREVFNKKKEGDPAKKFPATRPFAIEQDSLSSNVPQKSEGVNQKFSMRSTVEKQFSYRDIDSKYMELAADPEENEQELREMVADAAERNGFSYKRNTSRIFNPQNDVPWQMFVKGLDNYATENYGGYSYFATADGAIDSEKILPKLRDLAEEFYGEEVEDSVLNPTDIIISAGIWDDMDFVQYMWDNYFEDIFYKTGEIPAVMTEDGLIVFGRDDKRVKSAATVEYDDAGNVIPISKRFDTRNEDIRYSERNRSEKNLSRENEKLKADVENLRELLKLQGTVTGGKVFTADSLKTSANFILRETGMQLDADGKKTFEKLLGEAYGSLVGMDSESVTLEDILDTCSDAAEWLEANGKQVSEDPLRNPDAYELMVKVYDGFWKAKKLTTVADKYQGKIDTLNRNHEKAMDAVKASRDAYREQLRNQAKKHKDELRDLKKEMLESAKKSMEEVTRKYQKQRAASVENRKTTQIRHKIFAMAEDFRKIYTAPQKGNDAHAPWKTFQRAFMHSRENALRAGTNQRNGWRPRFCFLCVRRHQITHHTGRKTTNGATGSL